MEVKKIEPKPLSKILDEQYGYELTEEEYKDALQKFIEFLKSSKEKDMAKLQKHVVWIKYEIWNRSRWFG